MSILLKTVNLTKFYGEVRALKDFSIEIEPGAIGLLGPNGAGKSTLIKILLGLLPSTTGTGKVLSFNILSQSLNIRQRIGYMPEHDCLLPDLNSVSYLGYLGQLSGLTSYDAMQRAHEALDYVKIGDERYRELETYSTGMKQKVKLAQALLHDPELIFLDEPTSGLDPNGRRDMLKLIKGIIKDQGKNILFSTHILPDIEKVCDKVVIMNHGELVTVGRLKELLYDQKPDLVIKIRGNEKKFIGLLQKDGLKAIKRKNDILIKYVPNLSKKVVNLAANANVQLRYLDRSKHTLEELFIDLIEDSDKK